MDTIGPMTTERRRSFSLTAAGTVFVLLTVVLVAWNVNLPLLAYSPGPVSDAADAILVDGVETYATDGELVLLTVAGQDVNLFEALIAGADPSVDVLPRQAVRRPDESDEAYRRRNLQMMDESTATAISVALTKVDLEATPSVFVTGYVADTPAGQVLEIGDAVVGLDGEEIDGVDDLGPVLDGKTPGDEVVVRVRRDDEELTYDVELVAREDDPEGVMLGIFVRELPFWVDIDSGVVGGPSAGLMYSLAIIDLLGPDSLTSGRVVAGTGTIDVDGNVGPIGGVRQKVVAAEAAGAEYMLVPEGNFEAASTVTVDDLKLVPVGHIDHALAFLADLALTDAGNPGL